VENVKTEKYYIMRTKGIGGNISEFPILLDLERNTVNDAAAFEYASDFKTQEEAEKVLGILEALNSLSGENAPNLMKYDIIRRVVITEKVVKDNATD